MDHCNSDFVTFAISAGLKHNFDLYHTNDGQTTSPPGTFIQSDIISVPNNPDVGFDLLTRPAEVLMLQHVLIFSGKNLAQNQQPNWCIEHVQTSTVTEAQIIFSDP